MRLIRASFASIALLAFASTSCSMRQCGDSFKRFAGDAVSMPVPNAPVVEPKSGKPKEEPVKPEEEKPKVIQPPEFAKPAKLVPKEERGKHYEKIRTLDTGYVLLESNTGWLIVKDGEREIAKGKIIKKEDKPFRIIFTDSSGFETAIGQSGIFELLPVDTGGGLTPRPNF